MTDKKDNLIGRQLGDYKLTEAFAAGGMAQIYRGMDVKLGRPAAIKVLPQEILETDEMLTERFQREARAVANLEHDRIVPIYQYGEEADVYFLAMKFIEGEDLADELNRLQRSGELMDVSRMFKLLDQIADALDFAHQAGVVHRDIKPSNIMIDGSDRAYLTDFGLVLRHQVDKTMGTAFGTPRYISPEQALASERAVPQSDIYSLAVIVYEILTGDMVFKADTAMQIALSHISEPPPPPTSVNPAIPKTVEREILKSLDKVPEKRHKTATEFMKALRDAYGDNLPGKSQPAKGVANTKTLPLRPDDIITPVKKKGLEPEVLDDNPTVPYTNPEAKSRATAIPSPLSDERDDTPPTNPVGRQPEKTKLEGSKSEKADAKPKKRSGGFGRILLLLIIVVAAGGGAFVFLNNEGLLEDIIPASNPPPTPREATAVSTAVAQGEAQDSETEENTPDPTATEAPVEPVIAAEGEPATLHYNFDAFAFRNESRVDFDVAGLLFASADESDTFSGDLIVQSAIPAGECMLIVLQGRQVDIPDAWNCDPIHSQTQLPAENFFWRLVESGDMFQIRAGSTVIAECPALQRGSEETCEITWPVLGN